MRVGIFVTHPIQYFAPLYRELARRPGVRVKAHFFSDHSVRGGIDPGFGKRVAWDIPLLEGYEHEFLRRDGDITRPASIAMDDAAATLKQGGFDAVFIHGYTHGFERQLLKAATALGTRIVMRGEFTDATPAAGRNVIKSVMRDVYLRRFYRHVDAFCYIGQQAKRHLRRLGVGEDRLFFSPYAVDDQLFKRQRATFDRSAVRAELGIGEHQTALVFCGKLIERKAPLLLADAIASLPPQVRQRLHLIVVGDGALRQALEEKIRPALSGRAHLLGFVNQSQIGRFLAAADVFVLPSRFETWGLVVNEAMNFALPAIVGDRVGCHLDLVLPDKTGFVFPDGDAAALAGAIGRMIESPALRQTMGRSAEAHIQTYSIAAAADGIVQALKSAG